MKVNLIKSFRLKIAVYTIISLLATVLTDFLILFVLYLGKRGRPQEELMNLSQYDMANNIESMQIPRQGYELVMRMPRLTNYMFLDILILLAFSGLVFILYFILASHNMVCYLREISRGIDQIKEGDFDTPIRVKNEDELSDMAVSLNQMRRRTKYLIEKERLAEKTKNDLITNVAHDLRTPLTSIIGYLDLIRREEQLTEETRDKYLDIVFKKSKRLQILIEDLFDYTRFGKEKMSPKKKMLDINRFMEQLVDEFYPSFQENSLECQMNIGTEELMIEADGELLVRAFGNLLSNAIKYGADGKLIIVGTEVTNEHVEVSITNFGRIIPKQDINKIFDKFYRVENSRSLDTGGTGLGLAIAKNIVQMHNGSIQAASDHNGTVFMVQLPCNKRGESKHE